MTKADDLLARAYALTGIDEAETKALYRDWAATYDDTMLEGWVINRLRKFRRFWPVKTLG